MENKTSDFYNTVMDIILGFFSFTISLTIYCSYICYKKRPSYYDKLIQQKYLLQALFYLILFAFMIYYSSVENNVSRQVKLITKIVFDDYLIIFYSLQLFLCYERYYSICNPNLLLKHVIQQSYSFLYFDLLMLIASIAYSFVFYVFDFFKNTSVFSSHNYTLSIILISISFINSIILVLVFCFKINLENKAKSHYQMTNGIILIDIILFTLYGHLLLFNYLPFSEKTINEKVVKYSLLILGFIDSLLTLKMIYNSSFYYYYLGNSTLGSMYICCGCKHYTRPFLISGSSYYSNDRDLFFYNLYNEIGYILDDYIVDNFDYMMNATLIGLSLIYPNLKDDKFEFTKDNHRDDFTNTELDLKYLKVDNINIQIECLFTEKVKQTMNKYHVTTHSIIKSLLSNNYTSLMFKNSKDQYFQFLRSLCIKTDDKKLLLEIQSDYNLNDQRKRFIDRYFDHLNDNHTNTFLPVLIGIFIIQIDSFKPFVLSVSVNPLIENIPKDHFNFWELMRFSVKDKDPLKISTSKEKECLKITTELIFKENAKYQVDEHPLFNQILLEDLKFFRKTKLNSFSLIILYYEIEKSSKDQNENNPLLPENYITKSLISIGEDLDDKSLDIGLGKQTDISMITYKNDFTKTSITQNGFDCTYNKFKGILFFSFENIFSSQSNCPQGNLYHNYLDNITNHFNRIAMII